MHLFRFVRLRLRVGVIGWFAIIGSLAAFIWEVLTNADFIASKWPGKPLPFEMLIFFGGLLWLLFVAFWPELDQAEQPEVALVWDWDGDEKELLSRTVSSKSIVVHNRSAEWVYNVQVHPIKLEQEMTFDLINEIGPDREHPALARWGEKSSLTTEYIYFFSKPGNEEMALTKKLVYKKEHDRGISDSFLKIPMRITYDANGRSWQARFNFVFDPGLEGLFEKVSKRRI
jgi:hypothetical protein